MQPSERLLEDPGVHPCAGAQPRAKLVFVRNLHRERDDQQIRNLTVMEIAVLAESSDWGVTARKGHKVESAA